MRFPFARRAPPATLWALDLETSGLDPSRAAILAVGMVPVRERAIHLGEAFETRVRPPRDAPPELAGIRIHHLLPADVAGAPPLQEAVAEVGRRLAGAGLLVHGRAIDVPFLKRAFRAVRRAWPSPRVVDTMDLLERWERRRDLVDPRQEGRGVPRNLTRARRALGLPEYVAHDALSDAIATAELYLLLTSRMEAPRRQAR